MGQMTPDEVLAAFGTMTLAELTEFNQRFAERFDITASAPVPTPQPATVIHDDMPTAFNVVLRGVHGAQKINVIKAVRELIGLGLKEAKDFVEAAPQTVLSNVDKETTDRVFAKLQDAGANVHIVAVGEAN